MTPARGRVLLKKLDIEETAPGGRIILPESVRESLAAYQMEVVAVGPDEFCDAIYCGDDCERPHTQDGDAFFHPTPEKLQPGAWVLLKPRKLVDAGEDGRYLCSVDDVIAVLEA